MNEVKEFTPQELASLTHEFLQTEYGQYLLHWTSDRYNDAHHEAENDNNDPHQVAASINKAKGLKQVVDFFVNQDALYEQEKLKPKP